MSVAPPPFRMRLVFVLFFISISISISIYFYLIFPLARFPLPTFMSRQIK